MVVRNGGNMWSPELVRHFMINRYYEATCGWAGPLNRYESCWRLATKPLWSPAQSSCVVNGHEHQQEVLWLTAVSPGWAVLELYPNGYWPKLGQLHSAAHPPWSLPAPTWGPSKSFVSTCPPGLHHHAASAGTSGSTDNGIMVDICWHHKLQLIKSIMVVTAKLHNDLTYPIIYNYKWFKSKWSSWFQRILTDLVSGLAWTMQTKMASTQHKCLAPASFARLGSRK